MARLAPNTLALTLALAAVTSVNPLGTDMYLPALPAIKDSLSTTTAEAQATLSAFLFGAVIAQLVLGPWSDHAGRRPAILTGLVLFVTGSLLCSLAPTIEVLIAARVLQSFGGSGAAVIARSMVRDLFSGWAAGREFARLNAIRGFVPLISPLLGAALTVWFGWRANFIAMALFGLPLIVLVAVALPETLSARPQTRFSVPGTARDFLAILRTPAFRFYTSLNALVFSGFFAFLSGSAFVMQGYYGMSRIEYAIGFAAVVTGFITGSTLAHRVQAAFTPHAMLGIGLTAAFSSSCALMAIMATGWGGVPGVILSMAVFTTGMGIVMPFCDAGALKPFSDRVGSAASLMSMISMLFAALFGLLVGRFLDVTPLALPVALLMASGAAAAAFLAFRRRFS